MVYKFSMATVARYLVLGVVTLFWADPSAALTKDEWEMRYADAAGLWDEAQDLALQDGQEVAAAEMMEQAVKELRALEAELSMAFLEDDLQRLVRLRMSLAPKLCAVGRTVDALALFDQLDGESLNEVQEQRLEKDRRACQDESEATATTSVRLAQRFEEGKRLLAAGETDVAREAFGDVARDYRRVWIERQDPESLYWGALAKQVLGQDDEAKLLFGAYLQKPGVQRADEVENILVTMQLAAAAVPSPSPAPTPVAERATVDPPVANPSASPKETSARSYVAPASTEPTSAGAPLAPTATAAPPTPVHTTSNTSEPKPKRSVRPGWKLIAIGAVLGTAGLGQELWLRNDVVAGKVDDGEWEVRAGVANITYAWSYLALGAGGLFLYADLRGGGDDAMVGAGHSWRW